MSQHTKDRINGEDLAVGDRIILNLPCIVEVTDVAANDEHESANEADQFIDFQGATPVALGGTYPVGTKVSVPLVVDDE